MWNFRPLVQMVVKKIGRREPPDIRSVAERSWEIAPSERTTTRPALFLPDQLARVVGWAFADGHPGRAMSGGIEAVHGATRGYLVRDAWLIDGALYRGRASTRLQPRTHRLPRLRADEFRERAAVYCTFPGNRYFGQWLMDDCATYPLAAAEGVPVTTERKMEVHAAGYEAWLSMTPTRLRGAYCRELVLFDDVAQNRDKHRRCRAMREKLLSHVEARPHPGVFILRGATGQRRVLRNEMELAERLRDRRGFRVVDPTRGDVPSIVAACAGAATVIGVEGSGLMHGILLLPRGGGVLALQPPNRFVAVYKHLTDRDDQWFGFVVGASVGEEFTIDPDEVERTLDLFPAVG